MTEKRLGKIESVKFGHCGYQDAMLGLQLSFELNGIGTFTDVCFWDTEMIECSERAEWTEEDRNKAYSDIMRKLSSLLKEAKIHDVSELKGIPVEVTFEKNTLKDWRILTEVL